MWTYTEQCKYMGQYCTERGGILAPGSCSCTCNNRPSDVDSYCDEGLVEIGPAETCDPCEAQQAQIIGGGDDFTKGQPIQMQKHCCGWLERDHWEIACNGATLNWDCSPVTVCRKVTESDEGETCDGSDVFSDVTPGNQCGVRKYAGCEALGYNLERSGGVGAQIITKCEVKTGYVCFAGHKITEGCSSNQTRICKDDCSGYYPCGVSPVDPPGNEE